MSEQEIIWREPPPAQNNANKYDWFYEGIQEKPMEWAEFPGSDSAAKNKASRDPRYEATTRSIDGERIVFMRFDPDVEAPEEDDEAYENDEPETDGDTDEVEGVMDLDETTDTSDREEQEEITTTTPSFPG